MKQIVLLMGLLLAIPARADIAVRASVSPQRAQVGDTIMLAIDISGAQNVAAPTLGNLDGFDVQYIGPSTQVSVVNGQISASVQHRYSLQPLRPGHFTLGPFTLAYQGNTYQTAAVPVDIAGAGQPPAQPQTRPGGRGQAAVSGSTGAALRLTLSTEQQEIYLHQRIPVEITLYVPAGTRVADVQYPTFAADGLSVDKFPEPAQRQQVIDGQTVQVVEFQTTVVPLRAGALNLGPASLRLNLLTRSRHGMFNDPFFERFLQDDPFSERRPLDLRSDPIALNVLPLPEQDKPPSFSGAVGNFTLQVNAAPTELNAGDPITLRMAVSGTGNLEDTGPPELSSTEGFRTYEPRVGKSDAATKSFEQVLMPNDAGVRAVPAVRFSYFDPQARRYRTLESQPIALVVRPPQQAARPGIVAGGAARAPAEEKLGRDIVYIKDDPGPWLQRSLPWYGGVPFLLWQPVPLAVLLAAVLYDRRRQRLSGDLRYARFSRAGKQARHGLATAERALTGHDPQQFYDAVSRTMQEYLAAKLDLPPGAIDADAASRRGLAGPTTRRIQEFFATCEQVRFAPGVTDGDMRGTLAAAREIVRTLERERYTQPSTAGDGGELRGVG